MTETQLRVEAMKLLNQELGPVDTERFISLLSKDRFDYTEWREHLWDRVSVDDLWTMAREKGL